MVNHASDPSQVNVEFQWSQHYMHHETWLHLPFESMLQMDYPGGLILDLVATREIDEGEELYLDYGASWKMAWEDHVRHWKPAKEAEKYIYPADIDRSQAIRTVEEQGHDPYAPNLSTVCWTINWNRDEATVMKWTQPEFD